MIKSLKKNDRFFAISLLAILSIIWGSSFILMKKGLEVFSHTEVAALRIVTASLSLVGFILFRKNATIPRKKFKYIALMGLVGTFIPAFLFALAITNLKSSITGVLNSLTPMFTLIIGILFFSTPLNKAQLIGLIISFIGSIGLSFINSSGNFGGINFYALLVLVATICYGISTNIIKSHLSEAPAVLVTSYAMCFYGPVCFIYLFLGTDFLSKFDLPGAWVAFGYICILGAAATAIGLSLFNKLIQKTSPVLASSVTYLIPIVAIFWGVVDGEKLYFSHYILIIIILVGIFVINRSRRFKA